MKNLICPDVLSSLMVALCCLLCPIRGSEYHAHYIRLQDTLLNSYSKVIPIQNISEPVSVSLTLSLLSIDGVKEMNNEVTMSAWVSMAWNDASLKWDPAEFGNIPSLSVPSKEIWTPDITVYNQIGQLENETPDLVMINNYGHVMFVQKWSIRIHCSKGYDEGYNCTFNMASWTHHGFHLNLESKSQTVDLSGYRYNPVYELINTTALYKVTWYACCPESYPQITFSVEFKERTNGLFDFWN